MTSSYLHSQIEIPRAEILRNAAALVAPGGHLLVLSHVVDETFQSHDGGHSEYLQTLRSTPEEDLAELGLDEAEWE